MSQRLGPAANPGVQDRLRTTEKQRVRQLEEDMRAVLATPTGRRFVWALIDSSDVFAASMHREANLTAFNEGRRAVGLAVMRDAKRLAPESYVLMQQEALAAQAEEGVHRAAAQAVTNPEEEAE